MQVSNRAEMERFAGDIRDFAVAGSRQVVVWIHTGTVRQFGKSPGTPFKTGMHRSGGRVRLNSAPTFRPVEGASFYPAAGTDHIDQELAALQLGDVIHWKNRARAAAVLEGGRRFSTRLRRMVGSNQAQTGFLNHAIDEAGERLRGWKYVPGVT